MVYYEPTSVVEERLVGPKMCKGLRITGSSQVRSKDDGILWRNGLVDDDDGHNYKFCIVKSKRFLEIGW